MIGNEGAEDTWDNDGVANSPDDKMKAQNRGLHLVTPAGTMTGLKACAVCVSTGVYVCARVNHNQMRQYWKVPD